MLQLRPQGKYDGAGGYGALCGFGGMEVMPNNWSTGSALRLLSFAMSYFLPGWFCLMIVNEPRIGEAIQVRVVNNE